VRTIIVTADFIYEKLRPHVTKDSSLSDLRTLSQMLYEDFLRYFPDSEIRTRWKPSDEIRTAVRLRRKRQAKALVRLIESWGRELIPAPPNERPKAKALRELESFPLRLKLAQEAGILPAKVEREMLWLAECLEGRILHAHIDARAERGDY
jgi:hypothetical protein